MHAGDHPVRPVARSHTAARGALIADLVRAEGVDDEATIDAIALLVEGVFAVSASRREPETAKRAARSAQRVLDLARS